MLHIICIYYVSHNVTGPEKVRLMILHTCERFDNSFKGIQ